VKGVVEGHIMEMRGREVRERRRWEGWMQEL